MNWGKSFLVGAIALFVVFVLWRRFRFRPYVIGCVGFDWNRHEALFKEAARKATKAVGRRIEVKPENIGVALLVSADLSFGKTPFDKPALQISLGESKDDLNLVIQAIRKAVGSAELRRRKWVLWFVIGSTFMFARDLFFSG